MNATTLSKTAVLSPASTHVNASAVFAVKLAALPLVLRLRNVSDTPSGQNSLTLSAPPILNANRRLHICVISPNIICLISECSNLAPGNAGKQLEFGSAFYLGDSRGSDREFRRNWKVPGRFELPRLNLRHSAPNRPNGAWRGMVRALINSRRQGRRGSSRIRTPGVSPERSPGQQGAKFRRSACASRPDRERRSRCRGLALPFGQEAVGVDGLELHLLLRGDAGGEYRDRTGDLLLAKQALSQLS